MSLRSALLASVFTACSAWAGTVTSVTADNTGPLNATGVTSTQTVAQLAGMRVLFNFGSFSQTAFFNNTGQASTSNAVFSNTGSTDTATGSWIVQNISGGPALLSITITGAEIGNSLLTAFDRTSPNPGTAGSNTGLDVQCIAADQCFTNATAQYLAPIGISGGFPVGDLYGGLTINFSGGLADTRQMSFNMDTDLLTGPITAGSATPEPTTLALMGAGLMALGLARRKA